MARPLPKDLEQQIATTAKRAEIWSVAFFAFVLGVIVGVGISGAVEFDIEGRWPFLIGVGAVGLLWFMAARRGKRGNPDV